MFSFTGHLYTFRGPSEKFLIMSRNLIFVCSGIVRHNLNANNAFDDYRDSKYYVRAYFRIKTKIFQALIPFRSVTSYEPSCLSVSMPVVRWLVRRSVGMSVIISYKSHKKYPSIHTTPFSLKRTDEK